MTIAATPVQKATRGSTVTGENAATLYPSNLGKQGKAKLDLPQGLDVYTAPCKTFKAAHIKCICAHSKKHNLPLEHGQTMRNTTTANEDFLQSPIRYYLAFR